MESFSSRLPDSVYETTSIALSEEDLLALGLRLQEQVKKLLFNSIDFFNHIHVIAVVKHILFYRFIAHCSSLLSFHILLLIQWVVRVLDLNTGDCVFNTESTHFLSSVQVKTYSLPELS